MQQIEMYNPNYLNVSEFIIHYNLDMVLNNTIISNGVFIFELEDYEEKLNNFIEEVTEDPADYIDLEDINPEDLTEEIEIYCIEQLEENIYQWFIIPEPDVHYWKKYTNYSIYYCEELDVYLLGLSHWGMAWSFFFTEAPRPDYMKIKKYDEILTTAGAGSSEV